MALTLQEEQELADLESAFAPKAQSINTRQASPSRKPGDLSNVNMNLMTPQEEAELADLESQFYQPENNPQIEDKSTLSQIGEAVDTYSGAAPLRKAVGTFQETGSLSQAGGAFIDQFSQSPDKAPTGKDLMVNAGLSDQSPGFVQGQIQTSPEQQARQGNYAPNYQQAPKGFDAPSPAGATGFVADAVLDPTNLIPFAMIGKVAGKGSSIALKGSAKAAKAAEAFTGAPLTRIGQTIETGAKASAEAVVKARQNISKAFKPDVADDFNDLSRIAGENNIPSDLINEAHTYGEDSVVSRYARNNAEGPLGGLDKHEKLTQAVSEATENRIKGIAKIDSIPDNIEAGTILTDAYDEGVDNFFKGMGETYNSALKMAPDMRLDKKSHVIVMNKLNEMENWAKRRSLDTGDAEKVIDSASSTNKQKNIASVDMMNTLDSTNEAITKTGKSQAKEVLNAIRIAKNAMNRTGGDLNQVYSVMREMGDIAFKSKNSISEIPSDVKKFQEMYFTMQKGMTESVRSHLGDEFADQLIKNNSDMSKFFTKRGDIAGVIGNKSLSSEQIFKSLIMNGDSKKLDSIQSIVSPEAWDKLRGTYIHRMVNPSPEGVVNFKLARKNLNAQKASGKLKLVMSDDEIVKLDEVLRFGERGGLGVLSTSGTGASAKFSNMGGYLKDKIAGDALVDHIKNTTRSNYVEMVQKTPGGTDYVQMIKKGPEASKKTGMQMLSEKSPVSKGQSAQALRLKSIQERNSKVEKLKQARGY